ncbi:MAG TPA: YhjD/YihY/BrkB family envelope integrity protein [Gaiellaceae bacterium]|jgi:membrane protein
MRRSTKIDESSRPGAPGSAGDAPGRGRAVAARARLQEVSDRFDARYGRTPAVGFVRDVVRLDLAIAGGELAGALAYRLFLWFLPFVLLLVAGLGVYSDASGESPKQVADDVGLAGLVAGSVSSAARSEARWYAIIVGVPVLLYVTRGLLRTVIAVYRLAWGLEPRRGHLSAANVLLFLALVIGLIAVGAGTSAAVKWTEWSWFFLVPASLAVRALAWFAFSSRLPRRDQSWSGLVPGALVTGAGVLLVNLFTVLLIGRIAESRADTYGTLGVAAAVLLSLWMTSRVVVVSAEVNAVFSARRGGVQDA